MPNPIVQAAMNAGRRAKDRPTPIAPIPEEAYENEVFPYRGTEIHGVDPGRQEHYQDYTTADSLPMTIYMKEEPEPDPIPVKVVNQGTSELKRFRSDRMTVGGTGNNNQVQVVGRRIDRSSIRVTNMDATKTIYVAPHGEDLAITGYPLGPTKELAITTEEAVWCSSVDGTAVQVAILEQYSVVQK